MSWLWVSMAIAGAVLNAHRRIEGFYLWIASNTGLIVHNFSIGQVSQAILFIVFTGISIHGIRNWRRKEGA